MPEIKLGEDELWCMSTFHRLTGVVAKDCMVTEGSVVFIVPEESMGLAIGRKGSRIRQARRLFGKDVMVVGYSQDPVKFIRNLMYPIRAIGVDIQNRKDKKVARVSVGSRDRAAAIGPRGKNISRVKEIARRHHDIDDVIIV